jgi:hypothetical protein
VLFSIQFLVRRALFCIALFGCASESRAPARTATPEETRAYYPELSVVVTSYGPPAGCYLANEDPIVAGGQDPQELSRPAAKLGANFVTYLGPVSIPVAGPPGHMGAVPGVHGLAYWCPGR